MWRVKSAVAISAMAFAGAHDRVDGEKADRIGKRPGLGI
jgi:hypothetical protein